MAVPKYFEMYHSFLRALSDRKVHTLKDIKEQVIRDFELTEEEMAQMLPSGRQPVWLNRLGWCRTYLKKAELIESPKRAEFRITEEGERLFKSGEVIDDSVLERYPSFQEFKRREGEHAPSRPPALTGKKKEAKREDTASETPQEILERAHAEINSKLADELLSAVCEQTPEFFEKMVVRLLKALGYGEPAAGTVTQSSRDEGIDGIIYEDKLGFNLIYIQAKKWAPDTTVGRPEIQKFVGALAGQGATKGLFITTAQFSKDAAAYAKKQHTTKVILVDGRRLTGLMIEYDFGVTTEYVYKIKKMDTDFFGDEGI